MTSVGAIPPRPMFSAKKPNSIVGLDIESGSIAATELSANGSHSISRTAIAPLPPGVVNEGEVQDAAALSEALRSLFAKNKLGKAVRVGVANQRVVVRTMRLPLIEDATERETAIRFQAQDQIPMPLDQAVLDHQVISRETGADGQRQMDVVAVAARRDMVGALLAALRKAGLRPVGIDLAAFGMIRALADGNGAGEPALDTEPAPDTEPAAPLTTLYCHFGDVTNLAVARGEQCLFTRVAPFGLANIAGRLAEREGISATDAREWLFDVGVEGSLEEFAESPGTASAAREVLAEGASKLIDELRVSLEFYSAQEGAPPIERVIVCGPGSMISGLPEQAQAGLGLGLELMSPAALSHLDGEDAARLTVSYGLALED